MCVVNGVRMSRADYLEYLQLKKDIKHLQEQLHRPVQYGFAYLDWPVIKAIQKRDWELTFMDWEFRPPWIRTMDEMAMIRKGIDPKTKKQGTPIPWLNAKAENLLTSKMWRPAAMERRCIVLTDYFFEWRHHYPVGKRGQILKTPTKFPYVIKPTGLRPVYMAGIWTPWKDHASGEIKETFAIVTTEANEPMRMIHNSKNRMPTFQDEEMAEAWLWGDLTEDDIITFGSFQWPSDKMEFYTVGKDFLTAEEPLAKVDYPELNEQKDLFG